MSTPPLLAVVALILLGACGSTDPRGRALAIHTGVQWVPGNNGETVTVLRDNPPLSGVIAAERGTFSFQTPPPPPPAKNVVWDGFELAFDRTLGHTFRDPRNAGGILGVAPTGPAPATRPVVFRWQSNGLLLSPGQSVSLHMIRRRYHGAAPNGTWGWDEVPDTDASVALDQRTKLVGVSVIVVTEEGVPRPRMNRRLAEMWIDSRAVDRLESATSSGGGLNARVYDADHRDSLDVAQTASASNGRPDPVRMQIPDEVWSVCGERYGTNIQFRLVNYGEVASNVVSGACTHSATQPDSGTPYCVGGWARAAIPATSPATIPLVFVTRYTGSGVAQAYPGQGILFGETGVFGNGADNGENTLAHEIGHYLGGDALFFDGAFGPTNLMADRSRNLTREQCAAAYANADSYLVR